MVDFLFWNKTDMLPNMLWGSLWGTIFEELQRSEAVTGGVLEKKVLLRISQYSQANTCVGVSF